MSEYQIVVCDRAGVPIDELPDATLDSVTWNLRGQGKATINMNQVDPRVTVPLLAENECQIYIETWPVAAEVPWWGVWWKCRDTARKAVFELESLESYFAKRFIDTASLYWADGSGNDVATEQLAIGWALVNYAQTGTNKNLNITAAAYAASGKTRFRRYDRAEHPNILDSLLEFPGLVNGSTGVVDGFDWMIQGMRDGRRLWTPFYPQRGSLKADLMMELGKNIADYDVDEDAIPLSTQTYATGGSSGDTKLENNYIDPVADAKYGRMQSIISAADQKDPAELLNIARSYTEQRSKPLIIPKVTGVRVPEELLGRVLPGDTVPVSIHQGRVNIEDTMRVSSVTWYPGKKALGIDYIPRVEA